MAVAEALQEHLTDDVILANDRTLALIELHKLYGDDTKAISRKLPEILELFGKATASSVVCLDYTMPDGEVIPITSDNGRLSKTSYFESVWVNPQSYLEEMRERGYCERDMNDGYLLITPVGGTRNSRGYLGARRSREFEQLDIAIAKVFADSIPRIEDFSFKVPY